MESAWSKILTLLHFILVCDEVCLFLELPKKAMKKRDGNLLGMVLDVMKTNTDDKNHYIQSVVLKLFEQAKTEVLLKRHLKAKLCSFGK